MKYDFETILQQNIRVLAKRAGLDPAACAEPKFGTPEMRVQKQARGLADGEFALRGGYVVCSTCGGNCGQCGDTGITDNVAASMDSLVVSLETSRPATILRDGPVFSWPKRVTMHAKPAYRPPVWMFFVGALFWLAIFWCLP